MEVGGGMAGCGIMHGGRVGAAVGWRVGGVGRAEGRFFQKKIEFTFCFEKNENPAVNLQF
jgi:hypothetical protein